jgi:uncharacterized protein involved in high-affinity Fe2+ transport
MNAEPLSKEIYNKAKKLKVEQIILQFSGGNDEGYLNIELSPYNKDKDGSFSSEIEDWAWGVYSYSGAGDGNDYGDNITYDLVKGKVSTEEWYHVPQTQKYPSSKLEIADEE